MFGLKRKLPAKITLELDKEEVAALCAALPFAFNEAFPDFIKERMQPETADALESARRILQGRLKAAFLRVMEKMIPYGSRFNELR